MILDPKHVIKKSRFLKKHFPNHRWKIKHLGNPLLNDITVITSGDKSFVIKNYGSILSIIKWTVLKSVTFYATNYIINPNYRANNEIKGLLWLKKHKFNVPNVYERLGSTIIIDFVNGIQTDQYDKFSTKEFFLHFKKLGKIIAKIHINGAVIGDCKAENILYDQKSYYFLDLEQFTTIEPNDVAKRVWDTTEFFFYLGHFFPFKSRHKFLKKIIFTFLSSYFKTLKTSHLSSEIKTKIIKELGKWKYVMIFLMFMNPFTFKFILKTIKEFKSSFSTPR